MTTPPPAAARSASRDLLPGLLLLALAAAGIAWFAQRPAEAPARPAASPVLLEGTLKLVRGEVFAGRLRVLEPSRLEFRIEPPAGSTDALSVSFGPPGPVEASPTDAPDAGRAVRWEAKAGDPPRVEAVFAYGLYVLRVAAPDRPGASTNPPPTARITVRALPAR